MSHLTHLRTFIEAYRTGSLSRAAEHLGITQPTATLHIQALEALVGKPLFIRRSRGVEGTVAADELARSVSPLLDGLELKISSLRAGSATGGTVHLAGPPDFVHSSMAASLVPLMGLGYQIRFQPGNKQRIYELLTSGTVDLAITASMPDEKVFGFAHLVTERLLLVHSPLLSDIIGTSPDAPTLRSLPLIAYDEELPMIRTLWSAMFQTSPDMQAAFTIPDLRIIRELVMEGHGWSVISDIHCAKNLRDGTLVTPTHLETAPTNNLYLVWNKRMISNSKVARVKEVILSKFPRQL